MSTVADTYFAPTEEMCVFLSDTLPMLSEYDELEQQDLAKRLIDFYDGPKRKFDTNKITSTFPWMYQAGLIDYESRYLARGGNRLFLRRKAGPDRVRQVLADRPDIVGGAQQPRRSMMVQSPKDKNNSEAETKADRSTKKKKKKKTKKTSAPPTSAPEIPKKKKRKKKCCDNPRIVRNKKTGKRRCKNCGRKLKPKKAA